MNRRELLEAAIAAAFAWRPKQTLYARPVKNNGGSRLWKIEPPCHELQKLVETMAVEYGPLDWREDKYKIVPHSWLNEYDSALKCPFVFDDKIFDGEMMLWKTTEDELRRHALWSGVTLEFMEN